MNMELVSTYAIFTCNALVIIFYSYLFIGLLMDKRTARIKEIAKLRQLNKEVNALKQELYKLSEEIGAKKEAKKA